MLHEVADLVFPWDKLAPYRKIAAEYARVNNTKVLDFSIGSPVDPVPQSIQRALQESTDTPAYPKTTGSDALLDALAGWAGRVHGTKLSPAQIVPTVGSKEAVAFLPLMLGLGAGDMMVRPKVAYPTYDIGATAAGCEVLASDDIDEWRKRKDVKLVWINYPRNPTGACASVEHLRRIIQTAREIGAVVASDECYTLFDWRSGNEKQVHPSILSPDVCDGDFSNLLMLYSFSKQLNLAGYRAAFIAGDQQIVQRLVQIRKQMGLIMPEPIQHAMVAAANNVEETRECVATYHRRILKLREIFQQFGYETDELQGSLYLWLKSKTGDCWQDVEKFAARGIVVAPGEFYDESATYKGAPREYLRISATVSDAHVHALSERICYNLTYASEKLSETF